MNQNRYLARNPQVRIPLAGLLAWLLPGAGHLFIGERARGLIVLVVIGVTFWAGVSIGGIKTTVDPYGRSLWFMGQICAGGHALASWALGTQVGAAPGEDASRLIAYGRAEEVAVIYTAICGMLNVLLILDVLARAERQHLPEPLSRTSRAGPGGR